MDHRLCLQQPFVSGLEQVHVVRITSNPRKKKHILRKTKQKLMVFTKEESVASWKYLIASEGEIETTQVDIPPHSINHNCPTRVSW